MFHALVKWKKQHERSGCLFLTHVASGWCSGSMRCARIPCTLGSDFIDASWVLTVCIKAQLQSTSGADTAFECEKALQL